MNEPITIYGNDLRVGDIMRFRMSKRDAPRWLRIIGIVPTNSGKRLYVGLDGGCADIVSKREKRQIIRGVAQ